MSAGLTSADKENGCMMEAKDLLRATDVLDWMAEHYAATADREGAEKAALIRATQTLCLELAHELLKQEADKP